MSETQRELLMIVPAFPPMPRPLKLMQYLPEFGWQPCVLSPHRPVSADRRFAVILPSSIHVETTPYIQAPSDFILARQSSGAEPTSVVSNMKENTSSGSRGQFKHRGAAGMVARRLLLWMNTPDSTIGWLPYAVQRGLRLRRRRALRAIYATGPPFTTILIGALLKRLTRLPFIADFRDAWVQDKDDPLGTIGGSFRAPYGAGRLRVLTALERFCIESADCVLFTSTYTQQRYTEAYPQLVTKTLLLFNGVEENDFLPPPHEMASFTFVYVGTLHDFQFHQVELFFRAFALARHQGGNFSVARVFFAGAQTPSFSARLRSLLVELEIESSAEVQGPILHTEAVGRMKGAAVPLLFAGDNRFTRLSKISDYAATQRPMLAFALEDSETAFQVRALGQTVYCERSVGKLASMLRQFFQNQVSENSGHPFPFPFPHPFHWKTSAMRVAEKLDEIVGVNL